MHWFCDQRADERGVARGHSGSSGKGVEGVRGARAGCRSGVRRSGVRVQPASGAEGQPAAALHRHPLRQRQGGLFADGSSVRHFAVLSNLWDWEPVKLIEWHREKAGTIERVHDVMKNDLAAGVLPSKYFGANAAWLRLAVIAYNVLTALKRLALP